MAKKARSRELEALRAKIDLATRAMLAAFKKRTDAAVRIGEKKATLGLPVRDSNREREVVRNAEKYAEKIGLSPKSARELASFCIRKAREAEAKTAKRAKHAAAPRRPGKTL
ncbi:MAG: chorismate mutase [Candidatus Micrarchaeia archaeon]|jgi:chorismate mutase